MSKKVISLALSDIGKHRKENQDAFYIDDKKGIFILCDGMGGEKGGGTASRTVTELLPKVFNELFTDNDLFAEKEVNKILKDLFEYLNEFISDKGNTDPELKGMGTTLVLALSVNEYIYIAHCGDSRAYLFTEGKLQRLTKDHSVIEMLLELGHITQEQVKTHPARGQISKFIGMPGKAIPDIKKISLKEDDILMLCSDGLTGMLNDDEIQSILSTETDKKKALEVLIDKANKAGGHDNITVLLIYKNGENKDEY
ncbi:MAG: Stp1/IreP family PP2C-type Ser/Thr phosphatase [Ignavibacteriae bacterium]|nr:Stp1/IreP family PP2C-type Ser/Thr phosphatase [Ignavibacteriota bacterium]